MSINIQDLNIYYNKFHAVKDIDLQIKPNSVTAFIGPSGCGKSTLLRSLNRMHEMTPKAYVEGEVLVGGENIYGAGVDPVAVRREIGMVFQRPNPFPTMSIRENVLAGANLTNKKLSKGDADDLVEKTLMDVNLWREVKDRLGNNATGLSGGQQQRLCIARAIAHAPKILLMDEPCSALDPISTLAIEDLIVKLRDEYTIVMVTHNMQQAARVSEQTAFFNLDKIGGAGTLVEFSDTKQMFNAPKVKATEDYISGRFG